MSNLLCRVCGTEVVDGCSCGDGTMALVRMLTTMRDDAVLMLGLPTAHVPTGDSALDVAAWLRDYGESPAPESLEASLPGAPSPPRETWCWASAPDAEHWHGGFATKEDAARDAAEDAAGDHPGDKVFVQRGVLCTPWEFVPQGWQVLSDIHEAATDECGDSAEDYPDVGPEGQAALDRALRLWAEKHVTAHLYRTAGEVEEVALRPAVGPPLESPKAAVSHVEREDGKILAVWNRRYGGWAMPGGKVEDYEPVAVAQARELYEETGMDTEQAKLVYTGETGVPSPDGNRGRMVHVFRVDATGKPRETEEGSPVTWLTRDEFLKWSPFAAFYRKYFELHPLI